MIKSKLYLNQFRDQNSEIKEFFDQTFKYFQKEIFLLRSTIFSENKSHTVFALIERAWVGVLNNAIIKAFPDDSVTLQEFGVYGADQKLIGRCDLLVRWTNKKEEEIYLLFEAKCFEERRELELYDDCENYYSKIMAQAMKYYEPEKEYYKDKNVYLITISFGWLRKPAVLNKAIAYFDFKDRTDFSTDFCYLYYEGSEGVWVYGKIYKPDISIL
jgi:hypothetical protein